MLRKLFYSIFVIILVTDFVMVSWTTSLAQAVNSSSQSKTVTFHDTQNSFVSGAVEVRVQTLLYEPASTLAWFNITMDFATMNPLNVTLDEIAAYEASSAGEFPFNYTELNVIFNPLKLVNVSHFSFTGYILIRPVMMVGNVTFGLSIHYWIYTATQTLNGGWGNLFLLQMHILPSILRPEGWMYANAATLIIGVLLLVRYFTKRIQLV